MKRLILAVLCLGLGVSFAQEAAAWSFAVPTTAGLWSLPLDMDIIQRRHTTIGRLSMSHHRAAITPILAATSTPRP
jgi:hypothetical protein